MPTFEEVARSGGHFDASFHVGGHGEPWPDIKCLVITWDDTTYVCTRREGAESVSQVTTVREALEMFSAELQAAMTGLPEGPAS
jgi:hypothetical protein